MHSVEALCLSDIQTEAGPIGQTLHGSADTIEVWGGIDDICSHWQGGKEMESSVDFTVFC